MTNQQSNEIRNQKQKFEISTAQMVQTHHETKFVKIDLNHLTGDNGASEGSSLKDLELMETTYKKRSSDLKIRESLKSSHMDMNSIKSSSDTDVIKTYVEIVNHSNE